MLHIVCRVSRYLAASLAVCATLSVRVGVPLQVSLVCDTVCLSL